VIEKSLAGPIGLFVKFSILQDHGVDKVFFLENDNIDASQKNIVFLARGEKATPPMAIAGMYLLSLKLHTISDELISVLRCIPALRAVFKRHNPESLHVGQIRLRRTYPSSTWSVLMPGSIKTLLSLIYSILFLL